MKKADLKAMSLEQLWDCMEMSSDVDQLSAILDRIHELTPPPAPEEREQSRREARLIIDEYQRYKDAEETCRQYEKAHRMGLDSVVTDDVYVRAKQLWLKHWRIRDDRPVEELVRWERKHRRRRLAAALLAALLSAAAGAAGRLLLQKDCLRRAEAVSVHSRSDR